MNYVRTVAQAAPGLLSEDDVLPALSNWLRAGKRVALLTLVSIEGGSPRPVGAQMAVCEDGTYAGYLSGGCLEQALALEATALLARGESCLVRYGRGSPYFDIKLPCGSGLDIFFDVSLTLDLVDEAMELRRCRAPFALASNLNGTGACELVRSVDASLREGDKFVRAYWPAPRMVLFGAGPSVPALCRLAAATGLDTAVWAGDEPTRVKLDEAGIGHFATSAPPEEMLAVLDPFTAVVLAFHEHGQEPAILEKVLASQCFYVGVLGNHAVHRERMARLKADGHRPESLARIRAPLGVIAQAKSQATLALGVLTEIMIEAKARNLVA